VIAYLPSPSDNAIHIGPLQLRAYGLMIALGVLAAIWMARRRWAARGHDPEDIVRIAYWAVPGGLIGARLYHVATDFNRLYVHNLVGMFEIWNGGLGIPGGVIGGVAAGAYAVKRLKLPFRPLLDIVAPALPLAQAIGRLGNWFNQELFGRPTKLPWGLEIDPGHIVSNAGPAYLGVSKTFQPCFAYEALWDLTLVVLLLLLDRYRGREPAAVLTAFYAFLALGVGLDVYLVVQRQVDVSNSVAIALFCGGAAAGALLWWLVARIGRDGPLRWGDLFALYVAGYATGRLWVESLRIDTANTVLGLRVNEWTSLVAIVACLAILAVRRKHSSARLATASNVPLFDVVENEASKGGSSAEEHSAETATEAPPSGATDATARQVAKDRQPTPES
jgi:prolipoprotein diacylglyceryl transferase